MLRRIAAVSPVVVLLDDMQWAEPTALGLLRHLGRLLVDAPILWVLGVRDTDERRPLPLRSALADLERRPSRRIALRGLGDNELAELAASLGTIDDGAIAAPVATRLREATARSPTADGFGSAALTRRRANCSTRPSGLPRTAACPTWRPRSTASGLRRR